MKKILAGWLALGAMAAGVVAPVAIATTQYGNTFNAYSPTKLLGKVRGQADYQRGSATWNRFQMRLLKDGVQRGSIVTFGAPDGQNYRGTVSVDCLLGAGNWKTQVRGVSTGGSTTVWDTSTQVGLTCG